MFRYKFTSKSVRQFRKLDKQVQFRIIEKLDYYCSFPDPLVHADPIYDKELGDFRFRIGDYRVVFDIEDNIIMILKVGHRRYIYK